MTIAEPSYDGNSIATIDWDNISWSPGTISAIKLEFSVAQDASNYFLVDWVAIGRPAPGASIALVQQETAARISGDAAEASERNTLGVQMRGNYTGRDLARVTLGLVDRKSKGLKSSQ